MYSKQSWANKVAICILAGGDVTGTLGNPVTQVDICSYVDQDCWYTGRAAQGLAKCSGSIYLLGGYGGDAAFPSDVLTLPLNTFAASVAHQQPALPEPVNVVVEEAPAR